MRIGSMDVKLLEVKERAINNPDGGVRITKTTVIISRGSSIS